MSSELSCPYCNSPVAVPVGAHPGQRIPCSRCGESFPYRAATDEYTATPSPMPSPVLPPPMPMPQRFSNRGIALIVLGVMILTALVGLLYALTSSSIRRDHDSYLPKTKEVSFPLAVVFPLGLYILVLIVAWFRGWNRRESEAASAVPQRRFAGLIILSTAVLLVVELGIIVIHARMARQSDNAGPPVPPVQPKELLALGYLPSDTDVIIGLHAGELLSDPSGKKLINHLGGEALNAHSFEGWSGLELAEMDHAVFGFTLDDHVLVHFTLVVRARRPIDQEQVRKALKAGTADKSADDRTIYPCWMSVNLGDIHSKKAQLWFADDQTVVVAGAIADGPHQVPRTRVENLANLRPELREIIEKRFGPSAPFWIVGRMPAPQDNGLLKLLSLPIPIFSSQLSKEEISLLSQVKRFGVWVTLYPTEMSLGGTFECSGDGAAKALQAYLSPKNRQGIRMWLAAPDAGPIERSLNQSTKLTQDGAWVNFQAKASADAIRQEK